MERWYTTLEGLFARVWAELEKGVRSDGGAARMPTLATIGLDGGPEMRTVVLRDARKADGTVSVHTDVRSTKVRELGSDRRSGLHVWDARLSLQTRLRGRVQVESGKAVAWLWALVPDGSRSSYGVSPVPGTQIAQPDAYNRIPDASRFAVLTMHIDEIEAVHLSGDFHRRAVFRRSERWRGTWLAP